MVLKFMLKDFLLHETYVWKTLGIFTYVFNWLYFTQCLTSFSSISHCLPLYTLVFDYISYKIDEVLLINPSANVFVYVDFNLHHKDWVTYSGETERPGAVFSILNSLQVLSLHQMFGMCFLHLLI